MEFELLPEIVSHFGFIFQSDSFLRCYCFYCEIWCQYNMAHAKNLPCKFASLRDAAYPGVWPVHRVES